VVFHADIQIIFDFLQVIKMNKVIALFLSLVLVYCIEKVVSSSINDIQSNFNPNDTSESNKILEAFNVTTVRKVLKRGKRYLDITRGTRMSVSILS